MNIAVYSITRDRLPYTQTAFNSLSQHAGVPFRHFVVDNGSTDGTQDWLTNGYKPSWSALLPNNLGIGGAANIALDAIFAHWPDVDVIAKVDNDCRVVSPDVLKDLAEMIVSRGPFGTRYVLSPRVEGINNQPRRGHTGTLRGRPFGATSIVGGLFHVVPAEIYREYRYPPIGTVGPGGVTVTLGGGNDSHFCHWVKARGGEVGYIEDMVVEHFEGTDAQAKRFPDYFERRCREKAGS